MGRNTAIQWCDDTVNPTMGCDGCELWSKDRKSCYAGVLHRVRGGHNKGFAPTFEEVTLFPGRMAKAAAAGDLTGVARPDKHWLDGMPRLIFVSDMSDALSQSVSFEYLEGEIIATVASDAGRRHRWLWLTKRPARMARGSHGGSPPRASPSPRIIWAGTSITTRRTTRRIGPLLQVGGEETVRFLSVEPQVEAIDLSDLAVLAGLGDPGWRIGGLRPPVRRRVGGRPARPVRRGERPLLPQATRDARHGGRAASQTGRSSWRRLGRVARSRPKA